jgi:hypothetical protein
MQVVLQEALDELFTFSDPIKRIGAMFLFQRILKKVQTTAPSEYAAFMVTLKADPRVTGEVSKATEDMAAAKDVLDYWSAFAS